MPKKIWSAEEARENAPKGGRASGKVRRENSTMRDILRQVITSPLPEGDAKRQIQGAMKMLGYHGKPNVEIGIVVKMAIDALQGDAKARDTIAMMLGEFAPTKIEDVTNRPLIKLGIIPLDEQRNDRQTNRP